jgi:polar amino acid transport system substrate-binding protein
MALLAGCASSGSASPGAADPSRSTASATSFPTRDVVSGVTLDAALHTELDSAAPGNGGSLTLGTTPAPGLAGLPHVGTSPGGEPIGADVDLRNAVAKLLGITWKVQYGAFTTILPGVQNGSYDVGQDLFSVTSSREQVVSFATYLTDGQGFLAASGSGLTSLSSITGLCGLTVGADSGSVFQQILTGDAGACAKAGKKPYTVQYFTDDSAIWLGLGNGRLDVYFGPTLALKYDAGRMPGLTFLGQVSTTRIGFVTAKGSPLAKVLSDAVNKLIADGEYAEILAKWGISGYGISQSQVNPVAQ